ncbi:hypothetical protein JAAARDRAFT_194101 [Jaapia argillacea MUCL 33604]|uniref:Carboxylesterase type B domain-containing protein n=1 Tax=Jaapia argillacea MUCL 33604 TaxID=933084 RepID=A0A067PSV8_9AGAM|nr:hypothetical protein JAAARDRAFT_194101 [Jaapia argillacea MUCL 33604]
MIRVLPLLLSAFALVSAQSDLLIQTTSGPVQGFLDSTTAAIPLNKWLGIPFAADTSGSNRWLPPQKIIGGNGTVFNASAYGPACLQGVYNGYNGTSWQSEDCLRVNVMAPANRTGLLPVYMWITGGGFNSQASSNPQVDGSHLTATGIVFASFNYRLALFAFPHSSEMVPGTQNLALLDARAAIEWLYENVASFGGDPNHIVLGGESVGAELTNFYISYYNEYYGHNPLIIGAIMQSADTSQPMWPMDQQLSIIASNSTVGCPTGPGMLDCLRSKDGFLLQSVALATNAQFQPVIDNITIFKDYVQQTKQGSVGVFPMLIGTNKDEGTLIVNGEPTAYWNNITGYVKSNNLNMPFDNLTLLEKIYPVPSSNFPYGFNASAAMWRDAHMRCLVSNLGLWRTYTLGVPVWRYEFDLVGANLNSLGTSIGTFHGSDIRFVFGNTQDIVLDAPYEPVTEFQIGVSNLMVTAWTNFIKDPWAGPQVPGWKVYDPADTTSLGSIGNSTTEVLPGDHFTGDSSCAYWNTILPLFPQTFPECGTWTC